MGNILIWCVINMDSSQGQGNTQGKGIKPPWDPFSQIEAWVGEMHFDLNENYHGSPVHFMVGYTSRI